PVAGREPATPAHVNRSPRGHDQPDLGRPRRRRPVRRSIATARDRSAAAHRPFRRRAPRLRIAARGPALRLAALVLLVLAATAQAHEVPGERNVVVQVETSSVAVLVTYRPPGGALGRLVVAAAGSSALHLASLKNLLAVRALAPVVVRVDGEVR